MVTLFSTFVIGLAFAYDEYQTAKEMQPDSTNISDEVVSKIKKEISHSIFYYKIGVTY
tara:strand:+ start:482 stop:655 length:174 start_codon:yes stop_codon:yes gene_type:complete